MKIRGSVVSLRFIFPHPPEDEKKKKLAERESDDLNELVTAYACWAGSVLRRSRTTFHNDTGCTSSV